jgi:hypothetical protein
MGATIREELARTVIAPASKYLTDVAFAIGLWQLREAVIAAASGSPKTTRSAPRRPGRAARAARCTCTCCGSPAVAHRRDQFIDG